MTHFDIIHNVITAHVAAQVKGVMVIPHTPTELAKAIEKALGLEPPKPPPTPEENAFMDPPRLSNRDKSQDQPCDGCGKPLWRIHPTAQDAFAWGHISMEDTRACPITHRKGQWPIPRDIREHTDPEKWCRHPRCDDTNWGGKDRLHMRTKGACPPYDINPDRHVSPEVRIALLKRAEAARAGLL